VATTVVFLDRLRSDVGLALYGAIGLVVAWLAVQQLDRLSSWIMR